MSIARIIVFDEGWLQVPVGTKQEGIRPSDYVGHFLEVEQGLEDEDYGTVLLVPVRNF